MTYVCFSKGIINIPYLSAFIGAPCVYKSVNRSNISYIMGWGLKPSTQPALKYADSQNIPFVKLEDGFLRSLGLGVQAARQHSLILDYSGIYYDATGPNDLENYIAASENLTETDLNRARSNIYQICSLRLSKYNLAQNKTLLSTCCNQKILVVDQTAGDTSVQYGMANATSFTEMLLAAIRDNPEAEILVKIHPDVLSGKKRGYLLEVARKYNCRIVAENINPWSLFDIVEHVYVVTSQLGFEALMAGKKVSCFGMPFYAGWGLTDDKFSCERRNVKRSLEQVFYAAYIQYTRYINPYTGVRCQLENTIKFISHQKQHLEKFRGKWLVYGFYKWKKRFIPNYLGLAASITFTLKLDKQINKLKADDNLLIWSSKITTNIVNMCSEKDINLWRIEDGFLRSVGLGGDLIQPLSLVIDNIGIYYDATAPSDLENLFNEHEFPKELLLRANNVRQQLVELKLSKYNVGSQDKLTFPTHNKIILVPGQVETDASIKFGSPSIKTNKELLVAVRKGNPDAFIIYKPHPDVLTGGRLGELEASNVMHYDHLILDTSIADLFEVIDELHTMSSLSGFEALLRNIKVVTYGIPFYAGWGLTTDKLTCDRRQRTLTLDQLVAATLILYPIYVDPSSGDVCDVETAIHILHQQNNSSKGLTLKTRLYRAYRRIFEKKR